MQNAQNQAGIDFSKFDLDTLKKQKDFDLNTKTIQANLDKALSDATSSKEVANFVPPGALSTSYSKAKGKWVSTILNKGVKSCLSP